MSFDAALRKKVTTPAFAFSLLRSSLMTSVSTRYTPRLSAILDANEVVFLPDLRDGTQCFREMPLARTMQGARQDLAMLGFGTAAMGRRAPLQRLHERRVETTYDQIRHAFLVMIHDAINDSTFVLRDCNGKFAETPVSNQVENALNKWILIASAVYARPSLAVFGCFGNLAGARLRVAQRCRGAAAIR